ncbi:hypothetical protein NQ315_009915 [Exocentrus adspersus]|uniref:Uncharacterized protein n=1 Tax=Exocentrus adspersus TaxID=1586481 RepID=A0AAV8WIP0_9CUCU|nr:hypothetical protein NQ315_009915 [Exocentrus adspersus]
MITRACVFLVVLTTCLCKYFINGPAKVVVMKAEDCKDVRNLSLRSSIRMHMFNRTTQVLDVNFSVPFDFDDSIGLSVKCNRIDKKQNPFVIDSRDACTALNNYVGDLWLDIQKNLDIPPVCPIKKGFYSVKNLYLDLALLKVKTILEGLFYSRVIFKRDKTVLGCLDFDLKLEEKV